MGVLFYLSSKATILRTLIFEDIIVVFENKIQKSKIFLFFFKKIDYKFF